MRKQMEEEIRAQLQANSDAMMNWDDKVYKQYLLIFLLIFCEYLFSQLTYINFCK